MVAKLNIVLIAVDEAHCVSSWGHDFRLQYRQLGILRELMPGVPILAVTATATPVVQEDIVKVLKLKNTQISKSGFDRPNFHFAVNYRTNNIPRDFRKYMIREKGRWKFLGSTIIYCITRKQTENMAEKLQALGMDCLPYHAGLPLAVRKETHEQFVKDKVPVITATIAFGMGIDKPDVRNIFHYGVSSSLEGYFQEAGRAGRDGMPARCVVFWSEYDFDTYRAIWSHSKYGERTLERKEQSLEVINSYVNSSECRRKFIMVYFEDNPNVFVPKRLDCCDNCMKKNISDEFEENEYKELDESGRFNFTDHAKKLLTVINELQGQYGMMSYVTYLLGQNEKKFSRFESPLFGSGKDKSKTWWKELGTMLLNKKYLAQKAFGDFGKCTVEVTREGNKFLQSVHSKLVERATVPMLGDFELKSNIWLSKDKTASTSQASGSRQSSDWINKDEPTTSSRGEMYLTQGLTQTQSLSRNPMLYSELVEKRQELADMEDCAPYMIASDKALLDLSDGAPESLEQMKSLKLHGFTQAKLRKYGPLFLKVTAAYAKKCLQKEIAKTVTSICVSEKTDLMDILKKHPLPSARRLTNSAVESYKSFSSGLNFEQIALKRCLGPATIKDHICQCMQWGYPIILANFVSMDNARIIIDAIKKGGMELLSQVKNNCPEHITFDEIKAVVNYFKVREHVKKLGIKYEDFEDFDYDTISTQKPLEPRTVNVEETASTPEPEKHSLTQFIAQLEEGYNNISTQKIADENAEIETIEIDCDSDSQNDKLTKFIADLEEAYTDVLRTVVDNDHCYVPIKGDSNVPETSTVAKASEGQVGVTNAVGPPDKRRKIETGTETAGSVGSTSIPGSETSLIDYALLDSP
nr:unnamed protein product [Callosobruchus chinensis]